MPLDSALLERVPERYRSPFLSDGWVHQKYLGWKLVADRPGLRVLNKRYGPFERYLMLLTAGGKAALEETVKRSVGQLGRFDIFIHDFEDVLEGRPPCLAGHVFARVERGERLLNIATYVVDLAQSKDDLWKGLNATARKMVRKAEKSGAVFHSTVSNPEVIDAFYRLYLPMARTNRLAIPNRADIDNMSKGGDLRCTYCTDKNGRIGIVQLLYFCENIAIPMYGAGGKDMTGTGQFVQWNNLLLAQQLGCRWYDLGGVSDPDRLDGIHLFKKSIGGAFVSLGVEYRCRGTLFYIASHLRAAKLWWRSRSLLRRKQFELGTSNE